MTAAKRRVAFLHFSDVALAGGDRMILRLVRGLANGPLDPLLITQSATALTAAAAESGVAVRIAALSERLSRRQGQILAYPWWKLVAVWFDLIAYNLRLLRLLRREEVGALWCSNIRCFLTALPAARLAGIPIIWNIWATRKFGRLTSLIYNLCFRAADIVVTEYRAQAAHLFPPRLLRKHPRRLRCVYTGIDDDYFACPIRRYGPDSRPSAIVTCCRICPEKGLDDLVSAIDLLRRRGRSVTAKVVGAALTSRDRAFERRLRERIDALGLNGRILICGWQSDVKPFLEEADLFVSASLDEGLPGAVREAQAAGKPVVATDIGGTREAVEHGVTGTVVPARNPAALADAMEGLLDHPEILTAMSAAAREHARRLFTIEQYVRGYSMVLADAVCLDHTGAFACHGDALCRPSRLMEQTYVTRIGIR